MKDFDKFKDLENFEVPYNPDHWLDMKKRLQKQLFLKKIKAFSAVAASLVVATGLAWYFAYPYSIQKNQELDSKTISEKTKISDSKTISEKSPNLDSKTISEKSPNLDSKTISEKTENLAFLPLSAKDLVFAPKIEKISPKNAFLPQMQPKDEHKTWILSLHGQTAALLKQDGKSFGGGIQLDYVVNKKLSLTTGFYAQFMNYESENSLKKIEDDDDDNLFLPNFFPKNFYETAREIKTEARIVDWQVGLKYNFAEKFYVKTDIVNSFFLRGEQSQKFREKDIPFANYMTFFEKKRVFLTHFYPLSGVDVAVGYEQKIKKVGLRVEPFVKIYRQNIGEMPLSKSQNMLGLRLSLVFAGI